MNKFIRTTGVVTINQLRKILWESVYSNVQNLESLINNLNDQFIPGTVEISFNFCDSTLKLKSISRAFDINEVIGKMELAYKGFISDMLNANRLPISAANECYNNINRLYLVTFINDYHVKIGL